MCRAEQCDNLVYLMEVLREAIIVCFGVKRHRDGLFKFGERIPIYPNWSESERRDDRALGYVAVQPAAGEEVSSGETPDPPVGCNGWLRLDSVLRAGRVTVLVPASSWRFRAAMAME